MRAYNFSRYHTFKDGLCIPCQIKAESKQAIESAKNQMADEMVKGKRGLMTMVYKSDDEGEAK